MLKPHLDTCDNLARDILARLVIDGQDSRDQTLTRVVNRLVREHGFTMDAARGAAAKAVAETDSRNIDGYLDLDASTSTALFVKVDGNTRVLSLAQILRFFE
ncbi:MAG: hypothetical protein L3J65_01015 [Robiginitomaculum sp.]|nr:hypothetical protein [Robiginitomaculum sp.]